MLKPLILGLTLLSASSLTFASEPTQEPLKSPEITEEQVNQAFGNRLLETNRAESLLLLAIGYDHLSKESPTNTLEIGVPFIIERTPAYWVRLFEMKESSVDVLVNNALMLLFLQSKNTNFTLRKEAALTLLKSAAARGYWPAKVYVSETIFEQKIPLKSKVETPEVIANKQLAFKYLTECSAIDFAPCSLKLGMLYLADQSKPGAWIPFFQSAVEVVKADERYKGNKEVIEDVHFALAVLSDELSLPTEQRDYYKKILEENSAFATPEVSH